MENIFFTITTSYRKTEQDSKGNDKSVKVTENYLAKSTLLYTDAEAMAIKSLEELDIKDFTIKSLNKSNIQNVYGEDNGEKFYQVKMSLQWEDDKGKIKTQNHIDLIKGNNIKHAIENIENVYSDSIDDYIIIEVKESKILDVFYPKN